MSKDITRAVLRYPGAKWRIADFILQHMPKHHSYLEPFFGSGAVLFRKMPAPIETINDINGDVVNLFRVVQRKAKTLAEVVAVCREVRRFFLSAYFGNLTKLDGRLLLEQLDKEAEA